MSYHKVDQNVPHQLLELRNNHNITRLLRRGKRGKLINFLHSGGLLPLVGKLPSGSGTGSSLVGEEAGGGPPLLFSSFALLFTREFEASPHNFDDGPENKQNRTDKQNKHNTVILIHLEREGERNLVSRDLTLRSVNSDD